MKLPVGRVKGTGKQAHTYTFLAPDKAEQLKVDEFVIYELITEHGPQPVYGRITQRQAIRLYPDAFALDPNIDPTLIAEMIGYQDAGYPLFELTVTNIGHFNPDLRDFINPRLPPPSGCPIYLATDASLTQVLNKRHHGEVGALQIGTLLSRPTGDVPITLDGAAITSTHLAIIASTGAGKSYLTAVLIEELLKSNNRAAILLIDPHNEYGTLSQLQNHPQLKTATYNPQVTVYQPTDIKIQPSTLTLTDFIHLLPDLSEKMIFLLQRALTELRKTPNEKMHNIRWTIPQLLETIDTITQDGALKGYSQTATALIWRIESVLEQSGLFDDRKPLSLNHLCRVGHAAVLQLNEVKARDQQLLVATLLRRVLWARTQTEKGRFSPHHKLYLPFPVFVIIEEAHRFAPASGDIVSSKIMKEILGEGRKFGVGMTVISQRPGKLDGDVISQCNTHCLLRIVNDVDQKRVADAVETVGKNLLSELPALSKGQVIIAGEAVTTPILCQVRQRLTPHGAVSKNAPQAWIKVQTGHR